MLLSDTFSRSHLSHSKPEFPSCPFSTIELIDHWNPSKTISIRNNHILQTLITYITNEWPKHHLIPTDFLPYDTHPSDITFCECILLKNEWIIVPTTFQAEVKFLIHQRHSGIGNCKKRARQSLFWPLLNSETEDMIKKWRTCLTFQNRQSSEPIINHPIPNQAWIKTDADPFRSYGHYLLMINCYSKFIVIEALKNLQFSTVMNKCKYIFSQFGTPKGLVTNNRPKPTSHYFKWFLRTWDFELLARIFTNQRD